MPPLLVIPALPRTERARETLPPLPALSELLRLSDAIAPDSSWRGGLLRDLRVEAAGPEAAVAAVALRLPAGRPVCLAAPVHAVAGLHRVHLHAAGILALPEDERSALAESFAAQFGPELRLHRAGAQWLLEAGFAGAADDTDPLEWLGAPLERRPAASPEQRQLRRLGAEIEMWLAEHPVNALRRRRAQLPVNLLWCWGGGAAAGHAAMRPPSPLRLLGDVEDAWLAGCAALAGIDLLPRASAWSGVEPGRDVVVLPPAADVAQLQALDSAWFLPALEDLRAGRIARLRLRVGRRMHTVRAGLVRRLLRRRAPWWQVVGA